MSSYFFLDQIPTWTLNTYYVETCNNNSGCPCNSNGFCRTLVLFHIHSGKYVDANLQGINMTCVFSRQKTIHEDNESTQLFVTKDSDEEHYTQLTSLGFYLEACRGCKKVMRIATPYLNFDHPVKNALCSVIKYQDPQFLIVIVSTKLIKQNSAT